MQQRSEATRAAILAAARKLFSKQGYDATGVAEICAEAGVSKGAFYHHFPTKQSTFLALLDDWLEGLDEQIQSILFTSPNMADGLVRMAGMAGKFAGDAGGNLPMFLEFWTQASRDPLVWQATIAPYQRYQQVFAGLVQTGIDEGSLRVTDPNLAARMLLALSVGLLLQASLDPRGADWPQTTEQSLRLLLSGLERRNE
ncbi:transcriptional regulator, TetR family [Longilinea arvoryzae]|uniref:Transcriptional regulator, TetR family n=1 Tax=Longilinea arvoryzae TaxID=360412 RepID=A0A0S7BHI9_9CHLR|nr:TetR/AcrR family transcriptional regulator [Longilinea arvoryzae]GAP12970.1 transcriptional regulator, TetR family [Longilinea arvoryzae]